MRTPTAHRLPLVLLVLATAGCASSQTRVQSAPTPRATPTVVTDATYEEARRAYSLLARNSPDREPLRERLLTYLLARNDVAIDDGSYEVLVDHVASVTELFTPQEIADGLLPARLAPAAEALIERGEPLGDEARVLSGLLILKGVAVKAEYAKAYYKRLRHWGFDARSGMSGPLEPYESGLLEVWQEHARLTPTPAVLRTLARLYIDQQKAWLRLFQSSERRMSLSATVIQGLQHTVTNVAAVFLRHGDIASAHTHVAAMGSMGGTEEQLLDLLEDAREDDSDGAEALLNLASAYYKYGRLDVTRALCLHGIQRFPGEATFLRMLAYTAATQGELITAMAWYKDALAISPDSRALYDEVLKILNGLIEQGLLSTDMREIRLIANRAAELLEERMRRWPDSPPPVKPEELYLAIGNAEMNVGNAAGAERHLRASLRAKPTAQASLLLGTLLERIDRYSEAATLYGQALKLLSGNAGEESERAEVLERLGDAQRMQAKTEEAGRTYERALALWDARLERLKGQRAGIAQLRRGVLLGRLQRREESNAAFEAAMDAAPELQETYSTILAYLVVSEPDAVFAHRVFRHAVNQISLDPEWKVYFALWLRAIAGRTGAPTDPEVEAVLEDMSNGDDWFAELARFASGKIDYSGLLDQASDVGKRTEAHFYEGARRLSQGDREGAREMFRLVLETRMVNFYEFAMAQELIDGSAKATPPPKESVPAAVPPAQQP